MRRNHADYPATKGRPPSAHDDLMIVYREGGETRAHYFDNEGHAIEYAVTVAGKQLVFLSAAKPNQPRFRLTYDLNAGETKMTFEVAPPNAPGQFKTYVSGKVRKKPAAR